MSSKIIEIFLSDEVPKITSTSHIQNSDNDGMKFASTANRDSRWCLVDKSMDRYFSDGFGYNWCTYFRRQFYEPRIAAVHSYRETL